MSDDQAVIAAHLNRHLGRPQIVRPGVIPRDVHVIPPRRGRRHWVLHTVGARAHLLEGHRAHHAELVMSLSEEWNPRELWPIRVLRNVSRAIDFAGETPREGDVYFNPGDSGRACPDVFALLIARSRQLGKRAEFLTASGATTVVYALLALTEFDHKRRVAGQLRIDDLPEVIAWVPPKPRLVLHRFTNLDMVEVHVRTRYGPLVYVYFGEKFHGLFADHRLGRRLLGRAPVIDEAVEDAVAWQHILFRPAVEAALRWARGRERVYRDCDYPLGHPEMCWREFSHGPQPELPELPDLQGHARPLPWSRLT